jgi:hypothetical protein
MWSMAEWTRHTKMNTSSTKQIERKSIIKAHIIQTHTTLYWPFSHCLKYSIARLQSARGISTPLHSSPLNISFQRSPTFIIQVSLVFFPRYSSSHLQFELNIHISAVNSEWLLYQHGGLRLQSSFILVLALHRHHSKLGHLIF